jgi:hypothetical protein
METDIAFFAILVFVVQIFPSILKPHNPMYCCFNDFLKHVHIICNFFHGFFEYHFVTYFLFDKNETTLYHQFFILIYYIVNWTQDSIVWLSINLLISNSA